MATPTKAELLETAAQLGLEVTEANTVAEIQAAIAEAAKNAPAVDAAEGDENHSVVDDEAEASATENPVSDEAAAAAPTEAPAPEAPAPDGSAAAGAAIAQAITEGIKGATEKKQIVITSDPNVVPRFSVVRNRATGEFMVRDNESRVLSAVQLKSVEEKEAALQETDVEER